MKIRENERRFMKYKYEFEAPDDFEAGCCYNCPLSYIDIDNNCDVRCVLNCRYDECPLETEEQQ